MAVVCGNRITLLALITCECVCEVVSDHTITQRLLIPQPLSGFLCRQSIHRLGDRGIQLAPPRHERSTCACTPECLCACVPVLYVQAFTESI